MSEQSMDPAFSSLERQPRELLEDAKSVREALFAARRQAGPQPLDSNLEIEDHFVPKSDQQDGQIPLRIYRPRGYAGILPILLYFHGGGFFCGDEQSDSLQCSRYALEAKCAVVCVSYRLAPENPFPAALNDCYRTLEFLWSESKDLRIDPNVIAVGGSSAGGNLAAAITLLARDRTGPKICFQMLLVPALDDRLETQSARQFTNVPDFARPEAEVMWRWYLGDNGDEVSPYAAPARAADLSRLPAAYILCAGLDPLRDEGVSYAMRLTEAGVAVELHLVPSIPHGFGSVPSAAASQRLLQEQVHILRRAFQAVR